MCIDSKTRFYVLREIKKDAYYDSDGRKDFTLVTTDIKFSTNKDYLDKMAAILRKGFPNGEWTKRRSNKLKSIYPGYDDFADSTFVVHEIEMIM